MSAVWFNEVVQVRHMHYWNFAYRCARKGPWEQHARDRERFNRRIANFAVILNPILLNHIIKCTSEKKNNKNIVKMMFFYYIS